MPNPSQNQRDYLVSERMTSIMFIAGGLGAVAVIVLILVLMSIKPQGAYTPADQTQYYRTVEEAAETIGGYGQSLETGAVTIPIERAMLLVAERGVAEPFTVELAQADTSQADVTEETTEATGTQDSGGAEIAVDSEALYTANCASCHQGNGEGIPGAFPPLAGHMPVLYNAEGGRDYLINVLLYGLQGEIVVEGQTYNGLMPAWATLSDAEIAGILNHEMTSWGNEAEIEGFEPYTPEDIAAFRGQELSAGDVYEIRQGLGLE